MKNVLFLLIICFALFPSHSWSKNRASSEDRTAYVDEYLQLAIDNFFRQNRYNRSYTVIDQAKIKAAPFMNALNFIAEPFIDGGVEGHFNNKHGMAITKRVTFTLQDPQGACHRAKLYLEERRYGKESPIYQIIINTIEDDEQIIELSNGAITKLSFTRRFDINPLVERNIITERNVSCPGQARISNSSRELQSPLEVEIQGDSTINVNAQSI